MNTTIRVSALTHLMSFPRETIRKTLTRVLNTEEHGIQFIPTMGCIDYDVEYSTHRVYLHYLTEGKTFYLILDYKREMIFTNYSPYKRLMTIEEMRLVRDIIVGHSAEELTKMYRETLQNTDDIFGLKTFILTYGSEEIFKDISRQTIYEKLPQKYFD